jgi:hypothetical protein
MTVTPRWSLRGGAGAPYGRSQPESRVKEKGQAHGPGPWFQNGLSEKPVLYPVPRRPLRLIGGGFDA